MVKGSGEIKAGFPAQTRSGIRATSPFVGRDDELRRLAAALTMAAEGQGGVIFLTGEPGIGKTRLVREALALARARGFTVLEGRAYPLGLGLAYAPILDAFDPLLRGLDASRLEALVSGLPDLGRLFGSVNLPPPEPLGDHALEKTRLFWAISRLVERLTQIAPVALFIDDLHWADPASLELFHYLVRGLASHRVLMLATYADPRSDTSGGLRALAGPLLRDGMAQEIVVPRLDRGAVDQLVRGILGGETPGNLLAVLDARVGGTPLFIESFIGALVDSGDLVHNPSEEDGWKFDRDRAACLPQSVRRLVLERLERLALAERRVLGLIAIMGDATPHTLLRAASSMDEEALLEILQGLRVSGLVVEGMAGSEVTYGIPHPLIREVAYTDMPEMARRRAHLAAIAALESSSQGGLEDVVRLARHYRGAGPLADPDRALTVLLAAGDRALALYANEDAAQHFAAALAVIRERGGLRTDGEEGPSSTLHPPPSNLPQVLERLGEAWERIGKREDAMAVWSEAMGEWERSGDAVAASRVCARLALAESDRGHFDTAEGYLRAGFAALADREPCQGLVDLYSTRFYILSRLGDAASIAEAAAQLLSVAERLGSPRAQAEAHLVASLSYLWQSNTPNAREHALRALMLAESFSEGQELAICCRCHGVLVTIGMGLGDHRFMRYHAEQGLALAHRLGVPNSEILLRVYLGFASYLAGGWKQSLSYCMEAVALARRVGHPRDLAYTLAWRALILALQRDLPEAEACISEARVAFAIGPHVDRYVSGLLDIAETIIALERGQVAGALSIARSLASTSASGVARAGFVPWFAPLGLMVLAEAQAAAGEGESALETTRKITELGPRGTPYFTALASRAEGLARQALGQREAVLACLTLAQNTFTALEMPFETARCLLEQAAATGVEQSKAAATAARQSLVTFERLGAHRHADRARRLLRGLGVPLSATRRSRIGEGRISARELEIARLVAEGLSTPEIAERLILSPHTVATHLQHVYTRLSIGSRRDLVKYLIEAGLLSPLKNT